MPITHRQTFRKQERLCSKKLIDRLFTGGGSHSLSAFPLRAVYCAVDDGEGESATENAAQVQLLISVPKKHFKRAVRRNRVKRQVREAYRKHKHLLLDTLASMPQHRLLIAFIWLADELHGSKNVESKVCNLLERIGERENATTAQ
ncbi:ribonuclease P protein component [Prevotella dentasini]|uniref:ribonuclease P protein component n=1 Tax=Prevotella dentasini TaxID=589537 RepID=UPI000469A323|nr:ribonuclease P protein component [Prevotella dentasini]